MFCGYISRCSGLHISNPDMQIQLNHESNAIYFIFIDTWLMMPIKVEAYYSICLRQICFGLYFYQAYHFNCKRNTWVKVIIKGHDFNRDTWITKDCHSYICPCKALFVTLLHFDNAQHLRTSASYHVLVQRRKQTEIQEDVNDC